MHPWVPPAVVDSGAGGDSGSKRYASMCMGTERGVFPLLPPWQVRLWQCMSNTWQLWSSGRTSWFSIAQCSVLFAMCKMCLGLVWPQWPNEILEAEKSSLLADCVWVTLSAGGLSPGGREHCDNVMSKTRPHWSCSMQTSWTVSYWLDLTSHLLPQMGVNLALVPGGVCPADCSTGHN